ncbi:MAG: MBL fold metallo-hydrolase [Pseudomonadales bacterium]|nr:MBL fold metallo-hydrolase [Candidatus Woesebacteria bacterium]MCB9800682.1 MBL fold metallo-hydrolase [Pseudomonadales bacterium]
MAQHGQSILIETNSYKLLSDVGEIEGAVLHNLKQIGISLEKIDDIVISHRHIDHIGALLPMLHQLKEQCLFLTPQLGETHIKNHPEKYRYLQPNPDGGYDLAISSDDAIKLNQYQSTEIVDENGFELYSNIFSTGCIGDWMMEQAIVIDQKEAGITLIVGCSHPTVEAFIEKAMAVTGNRKLRGIIGGMHFTDYSQTEMKQHAQNIKEYNPSFVIPGHCTTVDGAHALQEVLGDDIVLISKTHTFGTGNSILLAEDLTKYLV